MKKSFYLIVNADGNARVVKSYNRASFTETVFNVTVTLPEPRKIAGNIDLLIEEHIATVDGVEMIPLKYVDRTEKKS